MPNFVTAMLRHNNALLMIKVQAPDHPAPFWSTVGGQVEAGESAHEALIREVKEETGLDVMEIGALAYQVFIDFDGEDVEAHVYEVLAWEGSFNVQDPDEEILEAAFIPIEQALIELAKLDYLPMSEPPISYLRQESPLGTIWRYRYENGIAERLED